MSAPDSNVQLRVLFVDDEPSLLSALRRMLFSQRDRWSMQFAGSGPEALQMMQAQPVDVIVTDMRMPGMDGLALLREVQRLYPATERLVLSGYAEAEAMDGALGLAREFLSKPCEPDELIAAVDRAGSASFQTSTLAVSA